MGTDEPLASRVRQLPKGESGELHTIVPLMPGLMLPRLGSYARGLQLVDYLYFETVPDAAIW